MHAYTKYPDDDEENYFKEVPVPIVSDLEQHKFPRPERVHNLATMRLRSDRDTRGLCTYR